VVGIFTLDHNTLIVRSQSDDPDWQAEIEVSPSAAVTDPRAALAKVQGVADISAAFQTQALLRTGKMQGRNGRRVHLIAMEPENAAQVATFLLTEGSNLTPHASEPQVLIGARIADENHVVVGDSLTLQPPRRIPAQDCVNGEWVTKEQQTRIEPEVRSFKVVGVLGREGIGRKAGGEVVVIDYAQGEQLYAGSHFETRYWLKKDPATNLERLEANLGEAWSYALKRSVIIGEAADERAFRNGVRFAGLLALVLGLYVIFHTLSMSLVERVREVGVLHALGATRAQIGRVFFTEAVIIAGFGGAFGLAGGVALALGLLFEGVTTVGMGVYLSHEKILDVFRVPWPIVGPLVATGVALALLGSIYPLIKVRRTDAIAALRGHEDAQAHGAARGFQIFAALLLALVLPAVYFGVVPVIGESQAELVGVLMLGLGVISLFIALPLIVPALIAFVCVRIARPFERAWPLAGKLSARAMQRGPTRVAGAVAGIALVTAGYVGLRGMTRSLEAEIDVWSGEAFRDKVYVRSMEPTNFDAMAAKLHEYPSVIGVEPDEARTYAPFLLIGVREDELANYGPCKDHPELIAALRDGRGAIVSKRLSQQQSYNVGSLIHVQTSGGRVESFPVVAISDAYGYFPHPDERLYGVVSDRYMKSIFCIDTSVASAIGVRFAEGTPQSEAETIVRTALDIGAHPGAGTLETGDHLYDYISTDIERDFLLFRIIIALTVALAGLGVLNGQLLAALERAKELGVLKALGMSRAQVAGHVLLESAVVGVLGGLLGCALGSALIPVIVQALRVISGLALPNIGAGVHTLWGALGAVVVALFAGLYPIWRMNRSDAIAAVRTGG
jgi:putative ABC transport system permease protein